MLQEQLSFKLQVKRGYDEESIMFSFKPLMAKMAHNFICRDLEGRACNKYNQQGQNKMGQGEQGGQEHDESVSYSSYS